MRRLVCPARVHTPCVAIARTFCCSPMKAPPIFPLVRNFVPLDGFSRPDAVRIRVVSYNILAQVYVKSSLFPHSPSPSLKWKARSQAILNVIRNIGADFLCLQELDEYDSFYKAHIEGEEYSGVYTQRSGVKRDGCGIFYKHNCAELLMKEVIEYNDLVDMVDGIITSSGSELSGMQGAEAASETGLLVKSTPEDHGYLNDPRVRLKRDCVGIMAAFRLQVPMDHVIIVANTHLYWDPALADVKLAQAKYLLSRLAQFKTLVTDRFECVPSLILAGDFNSVPGDKVYEYLTCGSSFSVSQMECLEELPLPLCSVYGIARGEPPFTNCTPDFTNTLDYIFFSPSECIKPVSFLELPELESPDVVGFLPNYSHPSDHLPIGAEFELTKHENA